MSFDLRYADAALALAERSRANSWPNPNVGCVIVNGDCVVGRGWTQPGGRPHAEAMALSQAGDAARGATLYTTLEPCAHDSIRGPACADLIASAGIAHVVIGLRDPDPRTDGQGASRLDAAGVATEFATDAEPAKRSLSGWLMQQQARRPLITLKLAVSLDGCIATAGGDSQWITSAAARAHVHLERARTNLIIVGRRTYDADQPRLDVRLDGLETRSPARALLSQSVKADDWLTLDTPAAIIGHSAHYAMIEGGAGAAAAFVKAELVDRLLVYRAPILIGAGLPCLGDIGLDALVAAHGQWQCVDTRAFGVDRLEVYAHRDAQTNRARG